MSVAARQLSGDQRVRREHDSDRQDVDDRICEHGVCHVDTEIGEEFGARLDDAKSRSRGPSDLPELNEWLQTLDGQLRTDYDQGDYPKQDDETCGTAYCVHVTGAQWVTYRIVPAAQQSHSIARYHTGSIHGY